MAEKKDELGTPQAPMHVTEVSGPASEEAMRSFVDPDMEKKRIERRRARHEAQAKAGTAADEFRARAAKAGRTALDRDVEDAEDALHERRKAGLEEAERIQTEELLQGYAPRLRHDDPRPREVREAEVASVRYGSKRADRDWTKAAMSAFFKDQGERQIYVPLEFGQDASGRHYLPVVWNGHQFNVRRGRSVMVPGPIADIIEDSLDPEPKTAQARQLGPMLLDVGDGPGVEIKA